MGNYVINPDTANRPYLYLCRLKEELEEALQELPKGSERHSQLASSLGRIERALREHEDPYWSGRPEEAKRSKRAGGS